MAKITAVVNGHAEKVLLGVTLRSMAEAVRHSAANGHEVEALIVLDQPDAVTHAIAESFDEVPTRILVCRYGDPSASRNHAVAEAKGEFVGFLDGDDLWSFNWLTEAVQLCQAQAEAIAHPYMNVMFGDRNDGTSSTGYFWEHVDSEAPDFDASFLAVANCWSALSFARREIYLDHPYERTPLRAGYGFEDWHWNCITLAHGHAHRPVPNTFHFIRRRPGSQSRASLAHDVTVRPTRVQRFSYRRSTEASQAKSPHSA